MSRAAIRYAKALLSLANTNNVAEVVNADMTHIAETISNNKELSEMLHNPILPSAKKNEVLRAVFTTVNALTNNLFDTLAQNKRTHLLHAIGNAFTQLYNESKGNQIAQVTTATAITPQLEAKILDKVTQLTGKQATLVNTIDESILGGFILRVGDMQYNASIANKLKQLKREFTLN